MSELQVNKISPQSGTAITLGDSGDTYTVPSGVTLDVASGATADFTGATVTGLTDNNTWVQVAKVVNSSVGAASVEVQNCFTTTYKLYMIVCRMFRPSTDNDYCRMRLMTGTNTAVTASNYRRANTMFRSNNTTDTSFGDSDEFRIMEGVEDAAAESGGETPVTIWSANPSITQTLRLFAHLPGFLEAYAQPVAVLWLFT